MIEDLTSELKELKVGDQVPSFSLKSDQDEVIDIVKFRGRNIVIYFYPKDDTPGCTIEAKDFSCVIDEFSKLNTVIIGISKDSIAKHQKFRSNHDLKHILLSDVSGQVCEEFGCWVEKSMYGKKYMGIARKTFLINGEGVITKIWPNVKINGHVQEVLDMLRITKL